MNALTEERAQESPAPSRPLGELLSGIVASVPPELAGLSITSIHDDSRRVQSGGLFVAVAGGADRARHIAEAWSRGARVVIAEAVEAGATVPILVVANVRLAVAQIAARWYRVDETAERRLQLLGITGTNGKSTTAFMVRAILSAAGQRNGLLGTIEYDLVGRTLTANLTTPGPIELAQYVAECRENGAAAVVMEVSSHALDQDRAAGLRFAAGAFTNLTGDHLDYHGTMERYAAAKAKLFELLPTDGVAVINRDADYGDRMVRDCKARVVRFSLRQSAEISAKIMNESVDGTRFKLRIAGREHRLSNSMIGEHNVYNACAAAGLAHAIGVADEQIVAGLSSLRRVPGRLEAVESDAPGKIFVDYAHTDDALLNVLRVVKPLARRRIVVVFGCGGDRDRTKRPRMAAVAAQFADAIIVTSDNPRTEDPLAIIKEINAGFPPEARRRVMIEPDRRKAIHGAVSTLTAGDILIIAGKGHENYQIIGTNRLEFDDVAEARAAASRGQTEAGRAANAEPAGAKQA
ncbi:MAG: UDP-N-acetylmuramoyl-L-alanyl-D-glutamate--2,6-diaminopimelate ligase [Phycisphaerae bacterium]|nr:UDP-N-acetylmuramoyl-L-alanyl-D-glutamate--2,6-diaminopimelate ligase [Phycisphaerae bacterium]